MKNKFFLIRNKKIINWLKKKYTKFMKEVDKFLDKIIASGVDVGGSVIIDKIVDKVGEKDKEK